MAISMFSFILGMRLVPEEKATAMMNVVDNVFRNPDINPFISTPSSARILSGEEESVFAWIDINYNRGFFHGGMWKIHMQRISQESVHTVLFNNNCFLFCLYAISLWIHVIYFCSVFMTFPCNIFSLFLQDGFTGVWTVMVPVKE